MNPQRPKAQNFVLSQIAKRSRRLQFSLRMFLAFSLLIGSLTAWLSLNYQQHREEQQLISNWADDLPPSMMMIVATNGETGSVRGMWAL